ncbi:MAG: family 1 encapsulin nanocompartment shell protein [Chloroflexia bacterium]
MEQILMREASPLQPSQWQIIDQTVKHVASQILVGRRFLSLYGPLGYGAYTVPLYSYVVKPGEPVRAELLEPLPLVEVAREFAIRAQDLASFGAGQPFDTAPIAAAAALCAMDEDALIFKGLLGARNRVKAPLGDWNTEGQALADVSAAVARLFANQIYGPYTVVMHPNRYALLQRVYGRQGILEEELLEKRVRGGLFQSPAMPEDRVLVIAAQPPFVDLAVGQDMVTAYLESSAMEHRFRIFETVALRIKQPAAICTLEA